MKSIIDWIIACWRAVPENIVIGVFTGISIWTGRIILNKISIYSKKVNKLLKKIANIWDKQPSIDGKYKVIPSPNYNINKKAKKKDTTYEDTGMIVFIVIIISTIGSLWLREHISEVQSVFYFICGIFLCLSTIFILISSFTNCIQSSTLKFSIFALVVSVYINYSAYMLPNLVKKIPSDLNINDFLVDPKKYFTSIYVFMGLALVVVEIIVILIMLTRVIVIKIDSKVSINFCKKIIFYTRGFENIISLCCSIGLITVFSYLLTSGIFIEILFNNK